MSRALDQIHCLEDSIGRALVGKPEVVRLAVVGLLARGHLLIEDVPGVGKTTLGAALARAIGCGFQRIQFTSDMLPSDVLGVSIYQPEKGEFVFNCLFPIHANKSSTLRFESGAKLRRCAGHGPSRAKASKCARVP